MSGVEVGGGSLATGPSWTLCGPHRTLVDPATLPLDPRGPSVDQCFHAPPLQGVQGGKFPPWDFGRPDFPPWSYCGDPIVNENSPLAGPVRGNSPLDFPPWLRPPE